MNILFLTKSKKYTCETLKYLLKKNHVVYVVCKELDIVKDTELWEICLNNYVQIMDSEEMNRRLEDEKMPRIDLAISNTYGRLIKTPLLKWVKGNCINLHGAILPKYKGLFTYNHGLLNGEKEWGVTAHYVNNRFDEGDIIAVRRFDIIADKISVSELEEKTQKTAYELTKEIVDIWEKEGPIRGTPQKSTGKYYSREDFERGKKVLFTDTPEIVEKKIHAFWCPPYEGAYIEIGGVHFQLLPMKGDYKCDK